MTWANFNKYLIKILGSLLDQVVNVKLENCWSVLATLHYLFKSILISWKKSHQADTVDTFSLAGLSPARASSKSVKYFTTMTCLACFLDAIVSWTKSLFEKGAKSRAAHCVQGKSWIEAWNPNPTFSGGQRLFQSGSFYNIFLAWYLSEGNLLPEYFWVGEVQNPEISVCLNLPGPQLT